MEEPEELPSPLFSDVLCISVNEKDPRQPRKPPTEYPPPAPTISFEVLQGQIETLQNLCKVILFAYLCSLVVICTGFCVSMFIEYEENILEEADLTALLVFAVSTLFSFLLLPFLYSIYRTQTAAVRHTLFQLTY